MALYDLFQFRLMTGSKDHKLLPDLEVDEIHSLVGALVLLRRCRDRWSVHRLSGATK